MNNFLAIYNKILNTLHSLMTREQLIRQPTKPKLSDKELIALALSAEYLGIDSERHLFQHLPQCLEQRIERSVYNRRKRRLTWHIHQIQSTLAQRLDSKSHLHVVDSMPLEACKIARAKRSNICSEHEQTSPDYGYCAAQKSYYYGYKLHAVCTSKGVIKHFDISPASTHDIHYLNDIKHHLSHCVLVGDRGYLSQQWQSDLFQNNTIELRTPMRRNQRSFKVLPKVLSHTRKRIETLFSQLCDQFMIRRNYAKTFAGLASRVISKIAALTIIQYINHRQGININLLKRSIV